MSYRIASFNILKQIHKESVSERDFFAFIHDFVEREHIDILALQEVLKEEELMRIRDKALSRFQNWHAHYERPASGAIGDYGFAYLWNANRVSECSKAHIPRIYNEYKSDIRLARNPLYGRFSPKFSRSSELCQEFRLLDVHLRFTDEVLPNGVKINGSERRKLECGIVTGEIYKKIDTHRYGNHKPAFTLSLGDYNLSADASTEASRRVESSVVTYQRELTTLNRKRDGDSPSYADGYANSYDHFSFDSTKYESVPFSVSRVDAVKDYFGGDYSKYLHTVSDHVPIVIEIF